MDRDRLIELFEGDNGRLSMTRLLMFMSFPPATYELIKINSEQALIYFLGAFVTGYVLGKGADVGMEAMNRKRNVKR